MLSPQGSTFTPITHREDELEKVTDVSLQPKEIMKLLKRFSNLGVLHSKINFMFTCLSLSIIPKGFSLKWTEQTGFKSHDLISSTSFCIKQTSFQLIKLVLEASVKQLISIIDHIFSFKSQFPEKYWSKGLKNYQFMFTMGSARHAKKLKSLSHNSQLCQLLPFLSLDRKPMLDQENIFTKIPSLQCSPDIGSIPQILISEAMELCSSQDTIETPDTSLIGVDEDTHLLLAPPDEPLAISFLQPSVLSTPSVQENLQQTTNTEDQVTVVQTTQDSSLRIKEYNNITFTPEMIHPVFYDPANFQPICIDDVSVPQELFQLASLSPSFSPTPTNLQPPDGNKLHDQLMEYKRVLSWKYKFRLLEFEACSSLDEFVNKEFEVFIKNPWYQKSELKPPDLPPVLEEAFSKIYSSVMSPANWYKYQSNLSTNLRKSFSAAKSLPKEGIGIYCQDKSSRIVFASLPKTNNKVEAVLADTSKYKRLRSDKSKYFQAKIKTWYQQ